MTPEKYFITYLTGALTPPPVNNVPVPGVPVSGCVPNPMPEEFVTVELTGMGIEDQIDRPVLTLLSWSTSREGACSLFEQVNAAMLAAVKDWPVSRVELETGYNDTDTETHRPRYHARYSVVYLGG